MKSERRLLGRYVPSKQNVETAPCDNACGTCNGSMCGVCTGCCRHCAACSSSSIPGGITTSSSSVDVDQAGELVPHGGTDDRKSLVEEEYRP